MAGRGSDGGHNGVRSALMMFQTDEIQRFKIGVAPEGKSQANAKYVTKPFSSEARLVIETAVQASIDRVLTQIGEPRRRR